MHFTIRGLPIEDFSHLFELDAQTLAAAGVTSCVADAPNSYPCRVTLEDASPGEELLLLSYPHLRGSTPYAAAGPIYIRRSATGTAVLRNRVADQQRRRLLSIRAYDPRDWIVAADVVAGVDLEPVIERFFGQEDVAYLHVHNARHGCYACRVDRA